MEHVTNAAVVDLATNIVINKVVVDDLTVLAPDGTYFVIVPDDVMCDMGWLWDGAAFVPPVVEAVSGN